MPLVLKSSIAVVLESSGMQRRLLAKVPCNVLGSNVSKESYPARRAGQIGKKMKISIKFSFRYDMLYLYKVLYF